MIGIAAWQTVLDGLGWLIARLYDLVGNYGVSIILLTVAVRLLLLPLGIKQIRSMHQMQQIQPKIKEIQKKYKGNKQKIQEEQMKLYQDHGVNPLSSCLPLLLQLPVMFALISVLRPPAPDVPTHFPPESALNKVIMAHEVAPFAGLNLQCTPTDAGKGAVPVLDKAQKPVLDSAGNPETIDCGSSPISRAPYYLLIILMAGTSYYQQRQMQKAAPPGAAQQQQKAMQFLPLIFVFLFIRYPTGLTLYWTTTNVWQIGQQHFLLSALKKDQEAAKAGLPPAKGSKTKDGDSAPSKSSKKGVMARALEEAEKERARKQAQKNQKGGQKGQGQAKKSGPSNQKKKKPGTGGK